MLTVRVASEQATDGDRGVIITLDDITDLVIGPAHRRLGRRRPAHRARDQEPADADPALGRAHPAQIRQGDHHRPRDLRPVHRHDRAAGRRHQAHGRRVLVLRPHAEASARRRGHRRRSSGRCLFLMRVGASRDRASSRTCRIRRSWPGSTGGCVSQAITNIIKNATEAIAAVPDRGARAREDLGQPCGARTTRSSSAWLTTARASRPSTATGCSSPT